MPGQGSQPHSLGRRRRDALALQRLGGDRAHAHRVDIGAQRFQQLVLDAQVAAAFQHRRRGGCRGEADRVELSSGDPGDQLVELAAQCCRLPPVYPDGHDFGARGAQSAHEFRERVPGVGGPVQLDGDALAGYAGFEQILAVRRVRIRISATTPRAGRRRATRRSLSVRGTRSGPTTTPRSAGWPAPTPRPRLPSRESRCRCAPPECRADRRSTPWCCRAVRHRRAARSC